MTTENDFLLFANAATNIDSQATYAALPAITAGFPSGILASVDLNKVLRQATAGMAVLAAFMQAQGQAAVDNGNLSTLVANFEAAFTSYAASSYSFGTTGYQKFASGLIMQWGFVSSVSADTAIGVTFPIAYPNAFMAGLSVIAANAVTGSGNYSSYSYAGTTTGMAIANDANCSSPAAQPIDWFSLGH